MKMIIVDNYDSFTFNLYQMLMTAQMSTGTESTCCAKSTGDATEIEVVRNDAIDFQALASKKPSHVVLSPGPGHPGIPSDFGVCADVILRRHELQCAVLGVCLGHQGIVHYLGGTVERAPEIVHGKSSEIRVERESKLFHGLGTTFAAMRYHSLVAAEHDFPEALQVTARESRKNLIMALEHREQPIFGLQFHPESIGTPEGGKILRNFIELC